MMVPDGAVTNQLSCQRWIRGRSVTGFRILLECIHVWFGSIEEFERRVAELVVVASRVAGRRSPVAVSKDDWLVVSKIFVPKINKWFVGYVG